MSRRTQRDDARLIVTLVVLAIVLVVEAGWVIGWQSAGTDRTCTVTHTDRTTVTRWTKDGSTSHSDTRIYTTDCGVLTARDDILRWHWTSADVYGSIEPGRYRMHTVGWRFGLFSMFPNVLTAERVS